MIIISDEASRAKPTWSSKLQCAFKAWRALADGEIALDLPAENCCDMAGAIEIAKVIMPSVFRIVAFVDGIPDIQYVCESGKWNAFDLRRSG